jgi:hypothetical protein
MGGLKAFWLLRRHCLKICTQSNRGVVVSQHKSWQERAQTIFIGHCSLYCATRMWVSPAKRFVPPDESV